MVSLNQATAYESPAHSSTGTRSEPQLLPLLGSLRFHALFHSPPGVLFTFPSRYYFTIGHPGVFSLARWSLLIHTGFHVPHATRVRAYGSSVMLSATGLSPSRVQHSIASPSSTAPPPTWIAPPQPRFHGLGCSHFARRYYGNRFCFLFLWLLRCFSSPGCLLPARGSSSKG